jgi:hypothetical protein
MAQDNSATRFKKGNKQGKGRPHGSKNKLSRDLKEAIIAAANNLGMNNLGYGGVTGFVMRVGIKHPTSLLAALAKISDADLPAEAPEFSIDLDKLNQEELLSLERIAAKAGRHSLPPPQNETDDIDALLTPSITEDVNYEKVLAEVIGSDKDKDKEKAS